MASEKFAPHAASDKSNERAIAARNKAKAEAGHASRVRHPDPILPEGSFAARGEKHGWVEYKPQAVHEGAADWAALKGLTQAGLSTDDITKLAHATLEEKVAAQNRARVSGMRRTPTNVMP